MAVSTKAVFASLLVLSFVVSACGGAPPPPAAPAKVAPVAPPPAAPTRARWAFPAADQQGGLTAKLDLGDGQTLFVSRLGSRATAKADGPLTEAPTLALEPLVGVLKDGNDFAFVAEDGDVYVSHEPLGPLDEARNGPPSEVKGVDPKFLSIATGKTAIVGITSSGRLMRSSDYGRHWASVAYAKPKTYGHAVSVALDTRGNGLLMMFPQRVFVTHDDGATWAQIATPGFGADAVVRDGADRVFLISWALPAKLDGSKLVPTPESLEPLRKPKTEPKADSKAPAVDPPVPPSRTLLTGDRVVEFTYHKGARPTVAVASRALGDARPAPSPEAVGTSDLVSARTMDGFDDSGVSRSVAGWGSSLLYARADDVKDADGAVTTTLLRSSDYGATWTSDVSFKGHVNDRNKDARTTDISLGPNGWAYLAPLCPATASSALDETCSHPRIRAAGAAGFEDLSAVEEITPQEFVFDEAHGHVYALGTNRSHLYVYESPLGQNKFTRLKLLDATDRSSAAISVDPSGTLRVLVYDAVQWKLLRQDASGSALPALYVPSDPGDIALVGLRGLVIGDHRAWETADGGESWVRVAAQGRDAALTCTEAGCTTKSAERVGWELPAYQGTEKLVATTTETRNPGTQPQTTKPGPVPLQMSCKPTGTPLTVIPSYRAGMDTLDVHASDVRWLHVQTEVNHKVSLVVGGRTSDRELTMLGPESVQKPGVPATSVSQTSVFSDPDGVVAIRLVQALPATPTTPVAIDLASFSTSTGKLVHRSPKLAPYVAQNLYATAHLVDGGVLFQAGMNEPIHFLHDDGKEEIFSIPPGEQMRSAMRVGNRWFLYGPLANATRITFSEDNGQSWSSKAWRLEQSYSVAMGMLGGKPYLEATSVRYATGAPDPIRTDALFSLDTIGADPPAGIAVKMTAEPVACDALGGLGVGNYMTSLDRPLDIHIEETGRPPVATSAYGRVTHPTVAGGRCTTAYKSNLADVLLDAKGYSGFYYTSKTDPKTTKSMPVIQPLTCTAPK